MPIRELAENVEFLELTEEGGSFHLVQSFEVALEGSEVRYIMCDGEEEGRGNGSEVDGEVCEFRMMERKVRF